MGSQSRAVSLCYRFSKERQGQGFCAACSVLHGWNFLYPRKQLLKTESFFSPQVVFSFISIFTGEEEAVSLVRGSGRSGGGQTTLSRSGEIRAGLILNSFGFKCHRVLESEGAHTCCVMEPSAFLQAWPIVRRCEELKQRLIKEVSPCYLVPGNSLGRDSPVRLGWVSGAGRDCSASGPCQKVKLGEGMRLLVSKQVI